MVMMGVCIGLVRGVIAGPEYIAVAILKGSVLGGSLALILGGLEQIALRPLWRRLSLVQAILMRTAIYPLPRPSFTLRCQLPSARGYRGARSGR